MQSLQHKTGVVITSFFNPQNYANKHANFTLFRNNLKRQGVPLAVIECAFGKNAFELSDADADIVVRVRSDGVLWQKERLLSILLNQLPAHFRFIAWIDADIIFLDDDWFVKTLGLLGTYAVVQPFSHALRLGKNDQVSASRLPADLADLAKTRNLTESFVYSLRNRAEKKADYATEGGFAWAVRREILDGCGFYDKAIVGGGDWVMNSAFYAINNALKSNDITEKWSKTISGRVNGNVGFRQGIVAHLYHGSMDDRGYGTRADILRRHRFDPDRDLRLNEYGCFEWSGANKKMEADVRNYFQSRNEESGFTFRDLVRRAKLSFRSLFS